MHLPPIVDDAMQSPLQSNLIEDRMTDVYQNEYIPLKSMLERMEDHLSKIEMEKKLFQCILIQMQESDTTARCEISEDIIAELGLQYIENLQRELREYGLRFEMQIMLQTKLEKFASLDKLLRSSLKYNQAKQELVFMTPAMKAYKSKKSIGHFTESYERKLWKITHSNETWDKLFME